MFSTKKSAGHILSFLSIGSCFATFDQKCNIFIIDMRKNNTLMHYINLTITLKIKSAIL